MQFTLSPTQSQIQTALRSFLLAVLPPGTEVVAGQDNRVPEPRSDDFVVMTAIRRPRIETNTDTYLDVAFTASISGPTMTVTAIGAGYKGSLAVGSQIFGAGLFPGTSITALGTGTGGVGTYTVDPQQTIGSEAMAAGVASILQPVDVVFQLDVHGPNSPDNAQTISTLFRDPYGVELFLASGYPVTPLYADDPRQIPFENDQQQIETRWIVEAHVQANQSLVVPQQFFEEAIVGLIDVDVKFPP